MGHNLHTGVSPPHTGVSPPPMEGEETTRGQSDRRGIELDCGKGGRARQPETCWVGGGRLRESAWRLDDGLKRALGCVWDMASVGLGCPAAAGGEDGSSGHCNAGEYVPELLPSHRWAPAGPATEYSQEYKASGHMLPWMCSNTFHARKDTAGYRHTASSGQ